MNQRVEMYSHVDLYEIQESINDYLLKYPNELVSHINYQVSNGYHTVIVVYTKQGETK